MTMDRIALQQLLEKGSDADLLREMIGFVADRLMALEIESLCGAAPGERTGSTHQPAQRLPRPALGHPRRHARPFELTRIRQRWGAERLRRIFERTVRACLEAKIATPRSFTSMPR